MRNSRRFGGRWWLASGLAIAMGVAAAEPVAWEFPRTGSCHEGMAFADGVTGVLVWGGGDTVKLTVGRADMWDHRGGYPWLAKQSYTNIVDAIAKNDRARLLSLFDKATPKGEPSNPRMLPLGRLEVKALRPGVRLVSGTLDPYTGLGELKFIGDAAAGGESAGFTVRMAMAKRGRTFAMKFPADLPLAVTAVPATDSGRFFREELAPLGFEPAVKRADGFDWRLPADASVSLTFKLSGGELTLATARGETAAPQGDYAAIAAGSREHWKRFWDAGGRVHVPDPVIQRVFEYGMYRFGAMTDPDGVPAGLQGPWLEDDKFVPWNGDYHFNINVQECYSPAYRGGHFANLMPLFKMVLGWRPRLRENAKRFVGVDDGYGLPHSVDDRGVCIGGFWTGTIDHASTAWVAAMMMKYVRYSGDVGFLREGAFDFMRGAMNVYLAMMATEADGALALPLGPSPEWHGDDPRLGAGRNPSFQLAAAHRLARDLIEAAKLLGEKPDPRWLGVEARLPAYSLAETECGVAFGIFEGTPLSESHRHHSHMAGLYPFDIVDFAAEPAKSRVWNTYKNWTHQGKGMWTGWCVPWASILWTHLGVPDTAVALLHDWDTYFCNPGHGSHHNAVVPGFTEWDNGLPVMQMDGQCEAATAVMELLVHEVNGEVRYFRGCPDSWKEVSFENLRLADGRRVSGSRRKVNGKFVQRLSFK